MNVRISVVIPAYNVEATVGDTVRAVMAQPVARDRFECIVVDDGSRDRTAEVAEAAGATVVRLPSNVGASIARNVGVERASGQWVAFTDGDCVPSRRWLPTLLAAAEQADRSVLGLAGKTIGLDSRTPAARFVDLTGGLDAEKYLSHQTHPWAPGGNLAYRREDLLAVGGFHPGFRYYEPAEIQVRMAERFGGSIRYLPTAVVMHRHRATWRAFWKQQFNYGRGYANFMLCHADRWRWSSGREARAWGRMLKLAAEACVTHGERGLVSRGLLIKTVAQHAGFVSAYYSMRERRRLATMEATP